MHDQEILLRQGGVPYEAQVYRHVLLPQKISPITFYGAYNENGSNTTWLFLENLEDSVHVSDSSSQVNALSLAAQWIGDFHRICEEDAISFSLPFLKVYDEGYYLKWPRRTALFSGELKHTYPWIGDVCQRSEELVDLLLAARTATIIHGDYYTDNILFRAGKIYPIDWGWAAVAAGENDLAALTERWPAAIVEQCELEYQHARWPQGAPANFLFTLNTARLYLLLRWLGDRPECTLKKENRWRFDHLHKLAAELGLVDQV